MFLFEGSFGSVLHTGDCRLTLDCLSNLPDKYIGKKERHPKCRLDFVFLDCTFGKCYLAMPSKNQATKQVCIVDLCLYCLYVATALWVDCGAPVTSTS